MFQDYIEEQGVIDLIGSKNATREAFKNGLIEDGEAWMDMIKARNLTSRTYNTQLAADIVQDTLKKVYPDFTHMAERFQKINDEEIDNA